MFMKSALKKIGREAQSGNSSASAPRAYKKAAGQKPAAWLIEATGAY
ncbi:MAG: hypothetical protein WBI41_13285 [Azovibrio sp.]